MPSAYFEHIKLLVLGITLLSKAGVVEEDIELAEKAIKKFVKDFQNLYGLEFLTIIIHSLLHLPDVVLQTGPLHVMSCFTYEHINGELKKLVRSSNSPQLQIFDRLTILVNVKNRVYEDLQR